MRTFVLPCIALVTLITARVYRLVPLAGVQFHDTTLAAGVDFTHVRAATGRKYLVEIMGGGCAFLDFDRDGRLDIFLINGGRTPNFEYDGQILHGLYKNLGNGQFENATRRAGIREATAYGMGVAVGDYDNDGYEDLYLTYFGGPNQLYHNNGNGTFTDVTRRASVGGDGRWCASAAFLDYNNDGYLDLYVTGYVDFSFEDNRVCGPVEQKGVRAYCSPKIYGGVADFLFRNNGDGTFKDVSAESGISSLTGKSLGVVTADLNQDGYPEIYVANDTDPNYLFRNNGDGTFREVGLLAGVALSENGNAQSGMGVACADYDRNGLFDLCVTNLDFPQYLVIYHNRGNFLFEDVSARVNVQAASTPYVGFGVGFFDFDNDSDLDLFVVNGHIDDLSDPKSPGKSFDQRKLLFENVGRRFREVASGHGDALLKKQLSRGAAFGDYDNDGDIDILVSNAGSRPTLLRNDGGNQSNWLMVQLAGSKSNRDGIGAVLTLESEFGTQTAQVTGGGSYLSASDRRVHFGLGNLSRTKSLLIRWPSGLIDQLGAIETNRLVVIQEGKGIVEQRVL